MYAAMKLYFLITFIYNNVALDEKPKENMALAGKSVANPSVLRRTL